MVPNGRPDQRTPPALAFVMAFCVGLAHSADDRVQDLEASIVEAVVTTPMPGPGTPAGQVPSNVQVNAGKHIVGQHSLSFPDFMNQCVSPVSVI
jgi:hypothetical protein